ncbi:MAG: Rrf2 family transcriptional regulator [Spirochaetes bacterium]|nr:MAG: Rrf2 family transcriptional regulator [Spirochaetota bacterium]
MQIRRETDYAIRCVCYLCGKKDGTVAMVDEISGAMNIPRSFAAKILQKLVRAGIVASHQGAKGGFRIVREPASITLFDVVTVIEGPFALNTCMESSEACGMSAQCMVHPFWFKIRAGVEKLFKELTFDQFIGE